MCVFGRLPPAGLVLLSGVEIYIFADMCLRTRIAVSRTILEVAFGASQPTIRGMYSLWAGLLLVSSVLSTHVAESVGYVQSSNYFPARSLSQL